MCVEENSKTDKAITMLLSSETLCIFLTCMFKDYPLGEEKVGTRKTGRIRNHETKTDLKDAVVLLPILLFLDCKSKSAFK